MIRHAKEGDFGFLARHDHHLAPDILQKKITESQIYVTTTQTGEIVGWLRYGLFWDNTPFMNMLYFLEPYRRKGLGRELVAGWEADMRRLGHRVVLTSTQANEEGQHFYRRLGYADCGVLLLPGEPAELFMRKDL